MKRLFTCRLLSPFRGGLYRTVCYKKISLSTYNIVSEQLTTIRLSSWVGEHVTWVGVGEQTLHINI